MRGAEADTYKMYTYLCRPTKINHHQNETGAARLRVGAIFIAGKEAVHDDVTGSKTSMVVRSPPRMTSLFWNATAAQLSRV